MSNQELIDQIRKLPITNNQVNTWELPVQGETSKDSKPAIFRPYTEQLVNLEEVIKLIKQHDRN